MANTTFIGLVEPVLVAYARNGMLGRLDDLYAAVMDPDAPDKSQAAVKLWSYLNAYENAKREGARISIAAIAQVETWLLEHPLASPRAEAGQSVDERS